MRVSHKDSAKKHVGQQARKYRLNGRVVKREQLKLTQSEVDQSRM